MNIYPEQPGYKAEGTSADAAQSVRLVASKGRLACMRALIKFGPMTADEVAAHLGMDRLYIRPRMSELVRMGSIRETGERRKNISGRSAAVMWIVPQDRQKIKHEEDL